MSVPVSENLSVSHYQLNVSAANIERHEDAVLEHVLQSCPNSEHRFLAKEVCVCVCVCMCVCTSFRVSLSLSAFPIHGQSKRSLTGMWA